MDLVCVHHASAPARARCVECGSLLCGECRAKLGGRNYCRPCVPESLKRKLPGRRSPLFASILSIVPGLGQMFAGEKLRGLVFGASALALANLDSMPPPTVLAFLYAFNLFDAYSLAHERNARVMGQSLSASARRQRMLFGILAGATATVGIANQTFAPEISVDALWPVALGLYAVHAVLDRKEQHHVQHA